MPPTFRTSPSIGKSKSGRSTKPAKPAKPVKPAEPRLSRTRRPAALDAADWQTALRRQFGREQNFGLENLGREPVFSDFRVSNPDSRSQYRVAIRGLGLGENRCSCPDFATNSLGTCKHVEFTLAQLQARRGGTPALARGFRPRYSEIWLDYAGARQLRFRAGTACPPALRARAEALFDAGASGLLAWQRLDELEPLCAAAQAQDHELRCDDDVWQFVAQIRDGDNRRVALAKAYPAGAADPALAGLLKVPLYPYQAEGALFAARAGRALIGDEMGLGKTIQAIAAAELMARHFGVQRVLVVCPTSLKHQWKNEFTRFADRVAQVIHGLRPQRELQYRVDTFCKITNYETLARDADLIAGWAPDLVIADEAQRIKNWNTIAARALKRTASPYAVVLTGTPLENRLEELISIVQFVDQHRLGPTWALLDQHQLRDDAGRVVGYRALNRIGQTLAPVMLRRRKAEVLTQLPERVDSRIFVPLTPQQRAHHDENHDIVKRIASRWRKTGFLSDADQRRLTCALQNMRMACISTYLLDHETDHGNKVDELMTLLDEVLEDPAAKVVVFSQWLGTHELIVRRLGTGSGQRDWGYVQFNGSVPGEKRGALVERFHHDAGCRLFLSTDAGGLGLNLQHAAAVVVNMDLPWNPAVLEQRIGRVHRMGQSRGVQVVSFIGQGSIEEGMLALLAFKTSLFAGALDGGDDQAFMQGTRLTQFMESVEQAAVGIGEADADSSGEGPIAATTTDGDSAAPDEAVEPGIAPAIAPAATEAMSAISADAEPDATGTALSAAEPISASPAESLADGPAAEPTDGPADAPADGPADGPAAEPAATPATADPWAAMLEAGAALLQGLASARSTNSAPPIAIERDPVTGQASVRLPLPDPAVLQRLAKAFEPWLR